MAIEWRRVPAALLVSFAVDALQLVVANMLRPSDRAAWSIVLALDVIGPTLAAIGYAHLARRLAGKAKLGTTVAAAASATFAMLVLAAQMWPQLWMLPPFVPLAIGIGLALMVPRRWLALAVPAIALPIARLVVRDLHVVWNVASIVTALAIVVAASSTVAVVAAGETIAPPAERPGHRYAVGSSVLYAVSLCLPAFAITSEPLFGGGGRDTYLWGVHCVIYGWIVVPGWIANPLLLVAAILHAYRKDRVAFPLTVLAIASAVVAPFFTAAFIKIRYPHLGYFAWLASIVCLAIATARARIR
jgi:hypothetical protein